MGTIGEDHTRRTIEGERIEFHVAVEPQVHGVDRDVGLVAEHVMPNGAHVAALRHEVHPDLDGGYARLRSALVALVQALVLGAEMAAVIACRVSVEDVRVIEQEPAESDERNSGAGGDAARGAPKTGAGEMRAPVRVRL